MAIASSSVLMSVTSATNTGSLTTSSVLLSLSPFIGIMSFGDFMRPLRAVVEVDEFVFDMSLPPMDAPPFCTLVAATGWGMSFFDATDFTMSILVERRICE